MSGTASRAPFAPRRPRVAPPTPRLRKPRAQLPLLRVRVYRDEEYIKKIANEVDLFNIELQQTVEFIRKYGQKEAA